MGSGAPLRPLTMLEGDDGAEHGHEDQMCAWTHRTALRLSSDLCVPYTVPYIRLYRTHSSSWIFVCQWWTSLARHEYFMFVNIE